MGLCESYSYILEVVEKTITFDLADEDVLSLGWRTQNSYVSILASTGERRGGWPFFETTFYVCLLRPLQYDLSQRNGAWILSCHGGIQRALLRLNSSS